MVFDLLPRYIFTLFGCERKYIIISSSPRLDQKIRALHCICITFNLDVSLLPWNAVAHICDSIAFVVAKYCLAYS